MFPTILFSNDPEATQDYINTLIKEKNINSSYIFKIEPKEKTVVINQIRELNSLLQIKTPHTRLIQINLFDTATIEAQNAMLKILEEKTKDNQFVLVVSDLAKIVSTILSRCTIVDLFVEDTTVDEDLEKAINSAFQNRDVAILGNSVFQPTTREEAIELFKKLIVVLQKKIRTGDIRSSKLAKKAFDILQKLENNNLNPQLAVDAFLIALIRADRV